MYPEFIVDLLVTTNLWLFILKLTIYTYFKYFSKNIYLIIDDLEAVDRINTLYAEVLSKDTQAIQSVSEMKCTNENVIHKIQT